MALEPQQSTEVALKSEDDALVDTVIYLASLASEREAIEPYLEEVRKLTAAAAPGQPFTQEERQAFLDVQKQIKNYLVNQDPVRTLTEESLEQRLEERSNQNEPILRRKPYLLLIAVWLLSLAAASIVVASPLPSSVKPQLAVSMFWITLHTGIAWFYLSGLKNFKTGPRAAYRLIVVGTLITGLGTIQFPIIQAFDLTAASPFFSYGGLIGIFALASLFLYAGPRKFALLAGMKSRLTDLRLIIAGLLLTIVFSIVTGFLLDRPRIIIFDLRFAVGIMVGVFCAPAAILAWRIAKRSNKQYSRGLRWYGACMTGIAIGSLANVLAFVFASDPQQATPIYFLAIFIVTELLMLQAGYEFKKYTTT